MTYILTLKAPITTAADDIFLFFFIFQRKRLDISCESSAWQIDGSTYIIMIHT